MDEALKLRLVVPTTLINEILLNCHEYVEGGRQGIVRTIHRVKSSFYWTGLYADVPKHIQACEDCSTSKSTPHLRGHSPGNVVSDRPFQVLSMNFVIPLPTPTREYCASTVSRSLHGIRDCKGHEGNMCIRSCESFRRKHLPSFWSSQPHSP